MRSGLRRRAVRSGLGSRDTSRTWSTRGSTFGIAAGRGTDPERLWGQSPALASLLQSEDIQGSLDEGTVAAAHDHVRVTLRAAFPARTVIVSPPRREMQCRREAPVGDGVSEERVVLHHEELTCAGLRGRRRSALAGRAMPTLGRLKCVRTSVCGQADRVEGRSLREPKVDGRTSHRGCNLRRISLAGRGRSSCRGPAGFAPADVEVERQAVRCRCPADGTSRPGGLAVCDRFRARSLHVNATSGAPLPMVPQTNRSRLASKPVSDSPVWA